MGAATGHAGKSRIARMPAGAPLSRMRAVCEMTALLAASAVNVAIGLVVSRSGVRTAAIVHARAHCPSGHAPCRHPLVAIGLSNRKEQCMLRWNSLRTLLACTWLLLSQATFAVDPNGVWYGPSATKITVVATQDQLFVTISNAKGQIGPLSGKWNSIGERFSFQHNQWTYTAAIRSQAQIDVFNPNGSTSVWKRGRLQAANANMKGAAQSAAIARLWQAAAGATLQIDPHAWRSPVTLVDSAGKRFAGSARWLQAGQTLDIPLPAHAGMATGTVHDLQRITVAYGEIPSTGTRQ